MNAPTNSSFSGHLRGVPRKQVSAHPHIGSREGDQAPNVVVLSRAEGAINGPVEVALSYIHDQTSHVLQGFVPGHVSTPGRSCVSMGFLG